MDGETKEILDRLQAGYKGIIESTERMRKVIVACSDFEKRRENKRPDYIVKVDTCDICYAFESLHHFKGECGGCKQTHKSVEISARGGTQ